MTKTKDKNAAIVEKNKYDLRKLEEFYVNGTINDLIPALNKRKDELTQDMITYANAHTKPIYDRDGNKIDEYVDMNPLVVNNYFFKSICPLGSKIPMYSAEKLALAFDYYMDLISQINDIIGNFPPTLTSFCKLLGISLTTLREYKMSSDLDMRNIVEKIYDQIGDENITFAQLGKTKERSTLFRLKSQNEMVEKATPNVNITYKEVVNTDRLNSNIEKYKKLIDKKG